MPPFGGFYGSSGFHSQVSNLCLYLPYILLGILLAWKHNANPSNEIGVEVISYEPD